MLEFRGPGDVVTHSYASLRRRSSTLAGALLRLGVGRGDRVAVDLVQGFDALAVHLAVLRIGAISVPLSPAFAGDGLRHRLQDSGSKVAFGDRQSAAKILSLDRPTALEHVVDVDDCSAGDLNLSALASQPVSHTARFHRDQPAFIFYTSGSSGPPKGATTAARMVYAMIPGFRMALDAGPRPDDVVWTPSDWAWLGSLGEIVLTTAYLGLPIVTSSARFAVDGAYEILESCGVTCAFLVPAVLRRMHDAPPAPDRQFKLVALMTGGEKLDPELRVDSELLFNAHVNDLYGLTECTHLAAGCEARFHTPPGALGKRPFGRNVVVLDPERDQPMPAGEAGEIAIDSRDPIVMLGYWDAARAESEGLRGPWVRTGDSGSLDSDGFLRFRSRNSALLKVSGIRIGAEEIEHVLVRHPDVVDVGVVLASEDGRDVLMAYVETRTEPADRAALTRQLQQLVRDQIAAYAYPRQIVFTPSLPRTATGKVDREPLRARALDAGAAAERWGP